MKSAPRQHLVSNRGRTQCRHMRVSNCGSTLAWSGLGSPMSQAQSSQGFTPATSRLLNFQSMWYSWGGRRQPVLRKNISSISFASSSCSVPATSMNWQSADV
eukprot:m.128837 g.128837  ORF g.128837 m.128837 type:complete len:102 (+) comp9419_c0_seq7:89-394(+)